MLTPADSVLLRIIVGEEDRYRGQQLYLAIIVKALENKMAGATVLRAAQGFGRSRYIRTELNVDAGSRLPVSVEIVDSEDQINRFLPVLQDMVESGLVTLERVRAIYYPRRAVGSTGAPPPSVTAA